MSPSSVCFSLSVILIVTVIVIEMGQGISESINESGKVSVRRVSVSWKEREKKKIKF
jgi:hypothetical protein